MQFSRWLLLACACTAPIMAQAQSSNMMAPHKPVRTQVVSVPAADLDQDGVRDRLDQCPGTPPDLKVNAEGCTIAEQAVSSRQLNILFVNDSAQVDKAYYPEVEALAVLMRDHPQTRVEIGGHTSAPGSEAYNLQLSESRARAVARVLTDTFGIDAERVTATGYGETRLLDPQDNAQAHSLNRRIEATLYSVDMKPLPR